MSNELRRTRGTCPECIEVVPAAIIEDGGRIFIEKRCPEHGAHRALISIHPRYYKELSNYFFSIMGESLPQRDYILRLTARCNMQCPICLASANDYTEEDLPVGEIRNLTTQGRRLKLDLMGAEPTLRPDLAEIIRDAHERGHITALHTNGIKLGDRDYCKTLVDAGLDEVHLQFDGFSDAHDLEIRGQLMNEPKRRVLAVLEEFNLATDLVVTVAQGSNEDELPKVLDYAAAHPFVKEVFFLGCRRLGRATDDFADQCLVPDEVLAILEEKTGGRISRDDLRIFQKLYFALLAIFRVRKCFYIHHYMVARTEGGWEPISEQIDLPYLERHLDRFPSLFRRGRWLGAGYLGLHAMLGILRKGSLRLLLDGGVLALMLALGFDLSRIKRRPILLGFITACDPWIHDEEVSANCGKGEVSTDLGHYDSGADANIARERLHQGIDGTRNARP
ncbi:MAG: radical SAM protein [Pseudomonadota bacterium]